jgi:hypothetical protein
MSRLASIQTQGSGSTLQGGQQAERQVEAI